MSSFIALCVLSLFIKNKKFLSNFSLVDNYNAIHAENENRKAYLDGIIFVIIAFGILSHSSIILSIFYSQPVAPLKETPISGLIHAFLGRYFNVVDVVFFFSGFLALYVSHDLVKSGRMNFNIYSIFGLKYVVYATTIAIAMLIGFILPQIGSGPYYSGKFYFVHLFFF